jgi:uncharacterized protein
MAEVLALTIGVFLGATVSAFSGFAFSAVCGAVLFHVFEPHRAIPLMMACSITSQLMTMVTLRRSLAFQANAWLFLGGIAGVTAAVMIITTIDPRVLRWFFGAFLALYAAYLMLRSPVAPRPMPGTMCQTLVGTLGGAVGVLTAMPGAIPTVWCEMRGLSKEEQRACVQPFIIAMQIVALLLLALTPAGIPREVPYYLAIALPALCLGSWVGLVAFHRVDDAVFRKIVLLMLVASGSMLLR